MEGSLVVHRPDNLVDPTIQQSKVASVLGQRMFADFGDKPVKETRIDSAEQVRVVTAPDDAVDVVIALLPAGDELWDQLGRVLKVGRHEDDGITVGEVESGGETTVEPEVARELGDPETLVAVADRSEALERGVSRPVLYSDNLEVVLRKRVEDRSEPAGKLRDAVRFVEGAGNDRYLLPG